MGCSSGDKKPANSEPPKKEKVLIYARGADATSLDPALVEDGESAKVMNNIFDNLIKYKVGGTDVEPGLAETWDHDKDGKVWTFKLRKNVKFHDGSPLTADDVVFSFTRQMPPNDTKDMPYASFTFDPEVWEKVEKIDDSTVKITLKSPYAPFERNLAMGLAAPIISKKAYEKDPKGFGQKPIGTGPFKFEKWEKDIQIVLKANDEYWGGRPQVDKVIFKVVKEGSNRINELITGQVDMIDGIPPAEVARLKNDPNVKIESGPGMNINYISFRVNKKPFDDIRVRKAISMAFDRETAVKNLYQGQAETANGPLPPNLFGYEKSLQPYKYNPDEAKKLMAQAGYTASNKLKFDIMAYTNPRPYNSVADQLAVAFKQDLDKLGVVDAKIVTNNWQQHKSETRAGKGDMFLFGWIGDNGDPDNFLYVHFHSSQIKSGLNYSNYKNDKVDKLLADAATELNSPKRLQLYSDAQKIIVEEAPWIFVSHATDMVAMRKDVTGFKIHPTGWIDLKPVSKPAK